MFSKFYLTCVKERNHHGKAEDDVDRETPGHLSFSQLLPFLVFAGGEPSASHVPVFKWWGHIETEKKMQELVQEVFSPAEFLRGADLDNECCDKLCGRDQKEQAKGPPQSQSCVLWVVWRCALSVVRIVPSVKLSPCNCFIQSIENDSVHLGLVIILPMWGWREWYLFILVMVEDTEESQTWSEEADHWDYPPHCGE